MNAQFILESWKGFIITNMMPKIKERGEILEGNIFSLNTYTEYNDVFLSKQMNIILTSQQLAPGSKVLEIGFNSGFSALLMLMSNPSIEVTCVDIACHGYTVPCFHILQQYFGNRIHLFIGDSREVVPKIVSKFDMIHIDGAHFYDVAEADIQNSIEHCNNGGILIFDDIDFETLGNLWASYVTKYNMRDVNFQTYAQDLHSIKQYFY